MRKAVFLVGCGLLMAAEAAVMPSLVTSVVPTARYVDVAKGFQEGSVTEEQRLMAVHLQGASCGHPVEGWRRGEEEHETRHVT